MNYRFDEFPARLRTTQTGGRCGRGWVGVRGFCRRAKLEQEEAKAGQRLASKKEKKTAEIRERRASKATKEALSEKKDLDTMDRANGQYFRIMSKLKPGDKALMSMFHGGSATVENLAEASGMTIPQAQKWADENVGEDGLYKGGYRNAWTKEYIVTYTVDASPKLFNSLEKQYRALKAQDNIEQAPKRTKEKAKIAAIRASEARIKEETKSRKQAKGK